MEIPVTKIREFYKLLKYFSTNTEIEILNDFNRSKNFTNLIEIYEESKVHFRKFCSVEKFIGDNKRNPLPKSPQEITNTEHVVSVLKNRGINSITNNSSLDFKYIEREISPLRTTGGVHFETGKSRNSSGSGGLDFIGWNIENNLPILGEVKVKDDKNLFYAIIQLLTYLSELKTKNQIKRINYTNLFKNQIKSNSGFYLYILVSNYNKRSDKKMILLDESKKLAKNLQNNIKEIKEIVFLKLDNPSDDIEQI